jgi:integrase
MALFKVNTGTREQEVCGLRWEWKVPVHELDTSVFIIPADRVKNGDERLVVLNRVALSVIEEVRREHAEYVFTFRGNPVNGMNNIAWQSARKRAGLAQVSVHDMKHTFGRRLRAAGVSYEDRQDLLGHRSGRITTHYSAVELQNLIDAANRVCGEDSRKSPALVLLKQKAARQGDVTTDLK